MRRSLAALFAAVTLGSGIAAAIPAVFAAAPAVTTAAPAAHPHMYYG